MSSIIDHVREFHVEFDIPINNIPSLENRELVALRRKIMREEHKELEDAFDDGDLVEVADGLCDLIYTAIGTLLSLGIPAEACWDEVHRSNMAKAGGPKRSDGKQLKPEGWEPPDLESILGLRSARNQVV